MAKLKLAESVRGEARRVLLQAARDDACEGAACDPTNAKAPFREALACAYLGSRAAEVKDALHRAWRLAPGDAEVLKHLVKHDDVFARFETELARLSAGVEEKRSTLHQMVHRSHPMNMRNNYYKVWMAVWTPSDRECALSSAFVKVLKSFDSKLKQEAKDIAVTDKEAGKVDFGEDGMGVWKHMNAKNATLRDEGYALASIVLEDLICEKCYNEGAVYCATVESVSEGREDEERWLPAERLAQLHALRPKVLMGEMCATHPLKEWMIARMGENLRKQILIAVCLEVCMSACGLVKVQCEAMHTMRNLRRKSRGLPPLQPGEESEDDEIMEKSDYEAYQERTLIGGKEALALKHKGSQAIPGKRKPVKVGEGLPAPESGQVV